MKSFWNFFQSVKLAIVLFILITTASVIGTLIPQQRTLAEYVSHYGQLAHLFAKLQITNLYHSFWFIALLFLFALNIIICTLSRLSPKLRKAFRPKVAVESKMLLALKVKDRFSTKRDLPSALQSLKNELSSRRYRIREEKQGKKAYLLARKKTSGWFGVDVVHSGLLIILAGGIISGIFGFRTTINISEGETLKIPNADFKLRLNKFTTEYYPNGAVKDWKSDLSILEDANVSANKTIEVNHPLAYKGYTFYQSSYGWNWENPVLEIWAKSLKDPAYVKKTELRIGQRVSIGYENLEISVLHFVPDFMINEQNQIATRSLQPNNPAAFIEGWNGDEKIFSGWIFAKFPDFARMHSSQETDVSFELKDFKGSQYSGIQVSKDPGANFIWIGSTLLMLGLLLAFFWPTREIKVIAEEIPNKTEIIAGGIASKNREALEQEFRQIMASQRSSK